jgi:hypothetical protein
MQFAVQSLDQSTNAACLARNGHQKFLRLVRVDPIVQPNLRSGCQFTRRSRREWPKNGVSRTVPTLIAWVSCVSSIQQRIEKAAIPAGYPQRQRHERPCTRV